MQKRLDEYLVLVDSDADRRTIGELKIRVELIVTNHDTFYKQINASSQAEEALTFYRNTLMPLVNQVSNAGDNLAQQEMKTMVTIGEKAESSVSQSRWITIFLIAIALLVGGVVVWVVRLINSTLRQAVTELSEGAEQVASAATQSLRPVSHWPKAPLNRRRHSKRLPRRPKRSVPWPARTAKTLATRLAW